VTRAVQSGKIRLTSEGKIDTADADARWPLDCEPDLSAVDALEAMSFDEAQRRERAAKAQLAEAELAKVKGDTYDADAIDKAWFNAARAIRNRLLVVPDAASNEVQGQGPVEAAATIRRHIIEALNDLADTLPPKGEE